jgi:MFS family permease
MGVGRFAFTPLLPLMQQDAGLTVVRGGWLASANYLGYLVGALAALSLRLDAPRTIRAALVSTAAATLAMGLTQDFGAWLALRAIAGVSSAFLLVFVSAWSLERVGQRALLRAQVFSGVGAGIAAVGAACAVFSAVHIESPYAWISLGTACFVVTALLWSGFRSDAAEVTPVRGTGKALPGAWRAIAAYAAAGFGYIVPATFLPVMATADGVHPLGVMLAWPVFGCAALVSTLIATALSSGSPLRTWAWSQAVMAFGVALPAFSPTLTSVVISSVCVGGTFMVVTMSAMQVAREFGDGEPRRLMAAMTAAFALGQLAGPSIVPLLLGPGGDFSSLLVLATAALIAGVFLLPSGARAPVPANTRKET